MSESTSEQNRRFLAEYDPDLLAELGTPKDTSWQVVPCAGGDATLRAGNRYLHHPGQPRAEAVQMVQHGAGALHLHFGLGLGWFLDADQPREDGALLVYEPDPAVFALASAHLDLAALLPARNAQVFLTAERYAKTLARYLKAGVEAAVFVSPYHQQHYPAAFQDFAAAYNRAHELRRHESGLDKEALPGIWASTVRSLPESTRAPGAEHLAGVLKDKPAVILSAGPSLERNVIELLPYRERVVVFAIARSVPVLARYGIAPDFLVHVEAQDFVHLVRYAENLGQTTFLLAEQAQRAFFQVPHGETFVFQSRYNPVTCWLNQRVPQWRKQIAATSGSVSATAFHMAAICGCSPITLLGHDLALKGREVYAGAEVNRAFRAAPKRLRRVPGYFGGQVTSLDHFVLTLYWYDEVVPGLLEQFPRLELFNATGAGAAVPRFAPRGLAEIAARYFSRPVDVAAAVAQALTAFQPIQAEDQLNQHLKGLKTQLGALTKEARAFLSLQRDLEKRLKRAKSAKDIAALQRKLPQIDRHNQRFQVLHQQHPGLEFFFNKQWQMFKQTITAVQQRNSGRKIAPAQWVTQFSENLGALGAFWRAVQDRVGYLEKTLF
ncbi:motility associated factor glycosyltransferase family protein [Acanthopleuribacter pedis]|uniref:Motility associated factor glycosyltransferase family protein n=1 Tax=Acanthopleuribacter pedis TaxID=442870 RepID=A0A8J7U1P4_9BACT|nr:6-hydroxymethylpterin diphosphokinase MptE-like protein [Acanthopleuribacter pedis]MBO1316889.1 motility associated factor glycosyltransferase family protein [Acanthopleuribacter pedis]